ncbi:DUF3667 domain-containing protein [Aliikangiella sp. G2MR2-5]|uniref:DUF3667 domain-containing protein n=1 Tax=Aliikangiella sp. G2MR2-5 TaxID=2788943 RepID=UPI0018AA40A7|nr:DUF3667 domain-containing protein [Aliikangiella sp. G2MR2-5]
MENKVNNEQDLCGNCRAELYGSYCSECGQKANQPIAIKPILNSVFEKTSELDFRFVTLAKALLTSPGRMIKEYLEGKRIIYTHPIKALFYFATAYLIVFSLLDISIGFSGSSEKYGKAVVAIINYLVFVFLALTSFPFKWIYHKQKLNWAESFVVLCYAWCGYLLLTTLIAPISKLIPLHFEFSRLAIGAIYLIWVCKTLFKESWPLTVLKAVLTYIAYFVCTMLVMTVVIFFAYLFQYEPLMISLKQ